jgi:hypothetical protein
LIKKLNLIQSLTFSGRDSNKRKLEEDLDDDSSDSDLDDSD